jgi:hypothetical protein
MQNGVLSAELLATWHVTVQIHLAYDRVTSVLSLDMMEGIVLINSAGNVKSQGTNQEIVLISLINRIAMVMVGKMVVIKREYEHGMRKITPLSV